ncbi:MAG TPA: ATP synthase F1 subunit delta [bacterium]|nr:ATP synthase F1 subunit delta [bacterium]
MDTKAVARYARALFNLAEAGKELDRVEKDLLRIRQLVNQYPEISHLVLNSTISQAEKEDFIEKVFPTDLSKLVLDFLKVLIKKRRFKDLAWMQEQFHRLYEKAKGLQEVRVTTAIAITKPVQDRLIQSLAKKLGCEIRLLTETDPDILGGMIVAFDGTQIDASYKTRLDELRQKLMA